MDIKEYIGLIPNFPKPGIMFRDILPLLENPKALRFVITKMTESWRGEIDAIVALDARGFIFGSPLSIELEVPLILARKAGKLPGNTESISYELEYGKAVLEIRKDSIKKGMRVLVVDDLLATGGTAKAACSLIERLGGKVAGCAFVIELSELHGKIILNNYPIQSLTVY